ncbi:MAG: FtsQ-type POTRA domain-containing protein [Candidatus Omnitrophica bacterium]|nr:FtsQ-type POTRA domain-containing protein [Candidatus Omnitrophota bacterium]
MVKRRQNPFPINIDAARVGIIAALTVAAVIISAAALSSFVRHSGLFVVKEIAMAGGLEEVNVPELIKLKGQNIFSVDLEKIQSRIAARYPQIAQLEVLRRFPDEILVSGKLRRVFSTALVDGKNVGLSRDGYFLGPSVKADADLPLIRGLQRQSTSSGTPGADPVMDIAFRAIEQVQNDPALTALHLRALDVSDPNKITFFFAGLTVPPADKTAVAAVKGSDKPSTARLKGARQLAALEDAARFDVVVDRDNCSAKLKTLSVMVAKTELALNEVKYIDLRFDPPVIGKKKVKK